MMKIIKPVFYKIIFYTLQFNTVKGYNQISYILQI